LQDGVIAAQGEPKDVTESYLEKLYEAQQGESAVQNDSSAGLSDVTEESPRDMRLDFINQTTLRNDIELFPFSSDALNFGKGGAKIINAQLLDVHENALAWVIGGERVKLVIHCEAQDVLHSPIIGFQIKDRLGQIIFGDNTYLAFAERPLNVTEGQRFMACFEFTLPLMPVGDYVVATAVAEGSTEEHIQHHWVHESFAFKVHSSSLCHGLVGIPMLKIEMTTL
jgi:lipopolysaccharide transport system ATP-binding protein